MLDGDVVVAAHQADTIKTAPGHTPAVGHTLSAGDAAIMLTYYQVGTDPA